jgi:hypothetical protein
LEGSGIPKVQVKVEGLIVPNPPPAPGEPNVDPKPPAGGAGVKEPKALVEEPPKPVPVVAPVPNDIAVELKPPQKLEAKFVLLVFGAGVPNAEAPKPPVDCPIVFVML